MRQFSLWLALTASGVGIAAVPPPAARERIVLLPFGGASPEVRALKGPVSDALFEAAQAHGEMELMYPGGARPGAVDASGAPLPAALESAREAISTHDYARAEAVLRAAIKAGLARRDLDFNDVLSARLLLAVAAFRSGDAVRADTLLVEIFRVAPSYAPALQGHFPAVFRAAVDQARLKAAKVPRNWLAVTGPARATLHLDGTALGMLPFRQQVAEGKHWVQVDDERQGHFQAIVDVGAQGAAVRAELLPRPRARTGPPALGSPHLNATLVEQLKGLCARERSAYALVGWVSPAPVGGGWKLSGALFSAARGGFDLLGAPMAEGGTQGLGAAARVLLARLVLRLREPGALAALPSTLLPSAESASPGIAPVPVVASKPPVAAPGVAASAPSPVVAAQAAPSAVAPLASDAPRAVARPPASPVLAEPVARAPGLLTPPPADAVVHGGPPSGGFHVPVWAWVAGGVVVAGVATYVAVSSLHHPVTGTLSATY